METFSTNTPPTMSEQLDFGFFLNNLSECLDRERGFSLFNADARAADCFMEQCHQQGLKPLIFRLSSKETLSQNFPEAPAFVIVIQDLPYAEFLNQAAAFADKLIFPLWFKRTAICFFSAIGRDAYDENPVNSEDLHKNYSMLINCLLSEQILSLLDRANDPFPSPRIHQAQDRRYPIDTDLDPGQRKAVESTTGPIRVLAPAGSGKTKTLVNHILSLLNQGVPAEKILALAFNKKARDEMQARLERKGVYDVKVRTFHSLGYEIVRTAFQWSFSGAAYQTTARELMRAAIHQHTDLPPLRNKDPLDAFLDGLRRAKMELSPVDTLTVEYGGRIYPFEPIFYSYLEKQVGAKFLDFDDMIYLAIRALLQNRSLRRDYQSAFEYVLVDEFQDLNQAQLLLMQILALPENNIFAVGDDDQMIYGFRGAEVKFLIEFDMRFPVSASHVLNINYRSSKMIVRHSGWLINHNQFRVKKDIQPGPQNQMGTFEISGQDSIIQQAEFAAGWLAKHKRENNLNWRDYAVLFRYNTYMFPVAMALDLLDIPHAPVSGKHLFQTAVGQDVYAYLSVILEHMKARQPQLERILKRPNKYFSNRIIAQARRWDTFIRLPETPELQEREQAKLLDFIARLKQLSDRASMQPLSASECLQVLKTEFGLGDFYQDQQRKSDDLDQASDEICFDVMITLAEKYKTAAEFYQFMCKSMDESEVDSKSTEKEMSAQDQRSDTNQVQLYSIHKAKGMEFQVVVYFNLSRAKISPSHIEEERRIAYVGVTRPKNDLLVTFSSGKPAEFLLELAQNPQYRGWSTEALIAMAAERRRRAAKETFHKKRLEAEKENGEAVFDELVNAQARRRSAWLNQIQAWRIHRAEQKISRLKEKIRAHDDEKLLPLLKELSEIEEEIDARNLLGLKK
jgi:DNA helicase II / ATP-dependent DNA helicase PcrA